MKPSTNVFDAYVDDYEAACARGLQLAGETRDFFAKQRVEHTRLLCQPRTAVRSIVDYGCGLGHTTPHLLSAFPGASVVGFDTGEAVVRAAQERYADRRTQFTAGEPAEPQSVDLVYCNGVFHHIPRDERPAVTSRILGWLRPGGMFALWENNPWNPGTRLVMRRIPFDRDADPLSFLTARRLLASNGFRVLETRFCFFFPSPLRALRALEPGLRKVPLGGQYCVLSQNAPVDPE